MSDTDSNSGFLALLAGITLGAVAAILLAPRPGAETRLLIAEEARDRKDMLAGAVDDMKEQIATAVDGAKTKVNSAVQAGLQAYRQELQERHLDQNNAVS